MGKLFLILLTLFAWGCKDKVSDLNPLAPYTEIVDSDPLTQETLSSQYLTLLNDHRSSLGLEPLLLDSKLVDIVLEHTQNMAKGSVSFGHTGFSERCTEGKDALGGGNLCGEIVAKGQTSAQSVLNSWLNSSGHKSKIEEERYTHTGIAVVKNAKGAVYWTQIFIESP